MNNEAISYIDLSKKLDSINKENKTVSMSLSAVKADEIIYTYNYGYSDKENKIESDERTIYRLASLSKFVTSILAMTLVDKGKLNLDEDISTYLGYKVRNPYFPDEKITIRHLLTHTSTIDENGNYSLIGSGDLPAYYLSEVLQEGKEGYSTNNFIKARPGEKFYYSSFGTGIVGAIIEKITGIRFQDYADKTLFRPLKLKASYDQRKFKEYENIAKSYEVGKEDDFDIKLKSDDPEWLKKSLDNKMKLADLPIGEAYRLPQGNLHISSKDLAKIVKILINDGFSEGQQILTSNSIKEMTEVYLSDENIKSASNLRQWDDLVDGRTMIGHYGRAFGVFTLFAFDPIDKTAVIALTNGTMPIIDSKDRVRACKESIQETYKYLFEKNKN